MKRYFSVDCEFSGLNHTIYDLISLGIVEVIEENGKFSIDYSRKFYIELKPLHPIFDPVSMEINGLNFNNLYNYGSEPKEACRQIIKYLDLKPGDDAIFIGYCVVLDKIYVDQLFLNANVECPFNYEVIEISSLAMGKLGLQWGFSETDLENKLNIQPMTDDKKHNALEDAIHQAEEFCAIVNS